MKHTSHVSRLEPMWMVNMTTWLKETGTTLLKYMDQMKHASPFSTLEPTWIANMTTWLKQMGPLLPNWNSWIANMTILKKRIAFFQIETH